MPLRHKDDRAFEAFVRDHAARLFRTALLISGDWQHAEDLTQTTLAKMYGTGAWSTMEQPEAYARRVLLNLHLSFRRRRSSGEVPVEKFAESAAGAFAADDPSLRIDLFAALAQLSRADRAVVVLRYWEDLSVTETATLLGLSASAVRSRSARALHKLRAQLDDPALADAGAQTKRGITNEPTHD